MQSPPLRRVWPGVLLLAWHAGGAVAWWWLMPGGFPVGNPHFWVNQVLPFVVLAVALVGLWGLRRKRFAVWSIVLDMFPAAWMSAAIVLPIVFPTSGRFWWGLLLWGLWLGTVVRRTNPGPWLPDGMTKSAAIVPLVLASLLGGLLPLSQRAPEPSTSPLNQALPELEQVGKWSPLPVTLRAGVQVIPSDASVRQKYGNVTVEIDPLLTFVSRSPDRCWSVLARRSDREGLPRRMVITHVKPAHVQLAYAGAEPSVLSVAAEGTDGPVVIDAWTQLDMPVYSHLNAFCDITVSGFRNLSLSFSPCPDETIEVTVSDYPVGRPRRLAFLDREGLFQVVAATSGEKGPFHRLAAGPLDPADPLVITLRDGSEVLVHITLDDWARQVSTDLSPTAGWGLPMNAIEFSRLDASEPGVAVIWISLAGTSVGRGWDTVGHAAGVYRNRVRIGQ